MTDNNTGYRNTGDWNTGDWNTGYRNTGNWNTGNWNTCDKETGFFNTVEVKTIRIFNKECNIEEWKNATKPSFLYFNLTEWILKINMTDKEKEDNESYKTTGGYLKEYDYKEAFQQSYNKASQEDKDLLLKLPNFNAEVFKEISGINILKQETPELTMEEAIEKIGFEFKIKK